METIDEDFWEDILNKPFKYNIGSNLKGMMLSAEALQKIPSGVLKSYLSYLTLKKNEYIQKNNLKDAIKVLIFTHHIEKRLIIKNHCT